MYCICQKFSAFWLSRYFDLTGIQWSKQVRYSYPGFECPKMSRNLPKILPKFKNFDICQKFWYIFDIFNIWRYLLKIDGYFWNFCLFLMKILQRPSYTGQMHTFKTVLARSRAEKNSFLGVWVYFCQNTHFWSDLDSI